MRAMIKERKRKIKEVSPSKSFLKKEKNIYVYIKDIIYLF